METIRVLSRAKTRFPVREWREISLLDRLGERMRAYVKIVDKINKVVDIIVVAFLAGAFLSTFLQVIMRNLTSVSVPWTDELSRYLIIYVVYFAAGLAARNGRLIRMEVLPMLLKLSEKKIQIFYWIASFLTIAFSVIVVYSSISAIQTNLNKVSASLGFSMAVPYLAIPIGSVWLVINMFANVFDSYTKMKEGKEEVAE